MKMSQGGLSWRWLFATVCLTSLLPLTTALAAPLGHSAAQSSACAVSYTVNQWGGGFTAEVVITNRGAALSGWTLTWSFSGDQQITNIWSASYTQSGNKVTARNMDYNASLPSGGTASMGFQASFSGSNAAPTDFALNGTACNGGTSPTAAPTGTAAPTRTASPTGTAAPTRTAVPPPTSTPVRPTPTSTPGRTWSNVADGFAQGTTGGAGGQTVTVTTFADLVSYARASAPYIIRVNGSITVTPYGYEIPVASNKTIIGVGTKGEIVHGGFHLNPGTKNVIIRNLTIRDTKMADDDPDDKLYDYDGIQMDTADHIWIDHNRIERMNDGLIDSRLDTTNLTVSWNIIGGSNKAFGIGWTDNVVARMTIHHNWIHDTNQRNPSVDNVALAHLYNNYLTNIASYGNLSRGSTKLVLENSYFDRVSNPYYNDTSAAQLRQSGSIVVNSSGKTNTNGSAFNPSSYYSYTLDSAAAVPALLKTYAGPQANIGQ